MSFSEPFVRRPIATTLLALALLVAGLVAFQMLAVSPLPKIDSPTVSVTAGLPGASPETMAAAVVTPLERRFGRIAGLTELTSTSALGSASINLSFDLDRDADSVARDVQAAIAASGGELPLGMPTRPTYRKVNPADTPILIAALTTDAVPLSAVYEVANSVLAQKISQVEGVGQVFVGGGQQPAVRVQVDPFALAATGVSLEDVRLALSGTTVSVPKGSLSDATVMAPLATNDQLVGAKAFRDVILRQQGGSVLRLRDVARVVDDVENNRVAAWADGRRAVLLIVRRQPAANIIATAERVKALLPQLAAALPPAIKLELMIDRTETIRASVLEVEKSLVLSVLLVIAVVFVFLRSARATLIPSVAVPLSLVGTFGVMYLLDYSLDNLSLMALTISTGFVVDDAIVVTENVNRYVEAGVPPFEAALRGARQIGFTIVSITASLLAVFIPVLLMGGIVGRLFREFAVTLSVAIAVSAVVSLTLTPMMCSKLLRRELPGARGVMGRAAEWMFAQTLARYSAALRFVLRYRRAATVFTILTVGVTVYLYVIVPKGLFPQQDSGMLMGFSEAPQDVSFPAMLARQQQVNDILRTEPEVNHLVAFMGGGPGGGAGNTGTVFVNLRSRTVRTVPADSIIGRLRGRLARAEGITLFLQSLQDVRIGGRLARTQYQYTLQDGNLEELQLWAPRVVDALRKIPLIKDLATDQQTAGKQLDLMIDRDTASRLGVSPQLIDATLSDAFGQRQVATTYTEKNPYRVILEVRPDLAAHPDALDKIFVGSSTGAQVPLSAVTKVRPTATALSVNHQGQFPSTTLSFNLAPGATLSQAVAAIEKARLGIGMPASVQGSFSGTAQAFQESLRTQPYLILFALLAVYIVLGILYESYIHPITILSTLPSAGLGALLALLVSKTELSIIALVGLLLLIGIVKKNAIMMIDFAIELQRDEGRPADEAIVEACKQRFRPILMTTLAALFGGLPLALGTGAGSELRRPLGITIVGGLVLSQVLTLFTTPVIYLALDRFTRRPRRAPAPAIAE